MTEAEIAVEEARLSELSAEQLLEEWRACEAGTACADLIAGEMERRNLDD